MKRTIVNPLFRDTAVFLETSAESGGYHSLFELTLQPGGKNLPHIHTTFTETFTAVKGTLGLKLADEELLLLPGETYTVLKNEVHNFFNPGDEEILFRLKFTPGHEGMEKALCILYGLTSDGLSDKRGIPKNLYAAAAVMRMSNSYPTGIAMLFKPVFNMLAARAKKKGIEQALIEKYYLQKNEE